MDTPIEDTPIEETQQQGKYTKAVAVLREILSWIFWFVLAMVVAVFVNKFVIINAEVPTGSMENTIMPGDRVIGSRITYRLKDIERGDVIVFHYPDDETELYVKRVIGLPGETIDIDDGVVYINGEALEEDYLKEVWTVAIGPYHFEVPEDCYFMMGDNRNNSWDSRYWNNSYVAKDKILGKAMAVYWPFADIGKVE
jgi:signal peptidase I